ncbi:MAG: pyridoxal kinase, partial [Microbacterium sp.]|nr:pyridoxal kinase [Microbacterium sp.]
REEGTIEMLVADASGAWVVQTPRLPMKANGSGDVTAALFTAHYVDTGSAKTALERTASSVFDLLSLTLESGERELQLIEAQEFYAHPRMQFEARQVR